MSTCPQSTPIYTSYYNIEADMTSTTTIILAVLLPLQLLCMLGTCLYTRSARLGKAKVGNAKDQQLQADRGQGGRDGKVEGNRVAPQNYGSYNDIQIVRGRQAIQSQQPGQADAIGDSWLPPNDRNQPKCPSLSEQVTALASQHTSKPKLIALSLVGVLMLITSLALLGVSIFASEQALSRQFQNAECNLQQKVSGFVNGTSEWMGLGYMVPNLTKLQLNLNTRVRATRNSIMGLVLNGTNVSLPSFPIGFPNNTRIGYFVANGSYQNTNATSVRQYIELNLRNYLIRNSSLSGGFAFPICQSSPMSTIQHPLNNNQTIELNYMDSICANLTAEVDKLVANGQAIDNLLVLSNSIEGTRPAINSNLTARNGSIAGVALRANEYAVDLSSSRVDVSGQRAVPFVLFAINAVLLTVTICYICYQGCKINKYIQPMEKVKVQDGNEDGEDRPNDTSSANQAYPAVLAVDRISAQSSSSADTEQLRAKKQARVKQILRSGEITDSKFTHGLNLAYFLVLLVTGLCTVSYNRAGNLSREYCGYFEDAKLGRNLSELAMLTTSQRQLLGPVQACTKSVLLSPVGSSSSPNFLQTSQTSTQHANIEQLARMSALYNASTPVSVFDSVSLQQVELLKGYMLHMETMPVKSQDFDMQQVLAQLNTYTNGSSEQSRQLAQCNSSVLRDQYVYNVADCEFSLIVYDSESSTKEPRCLQIPTYDGSAGSREADLNNAQHTIELNVTCPTIFTFYNGTNSNCFLGKRLDVLRTAGCVNTAAEYNRRVSNLLKFSVQTGSYTNSYLQNLRNYVGMYSVLSTNLTQFFNGPNMSQILNEFGTLSNNLVNKTSCSYVSQTVQQIQSGYCPTQNSISLLMYDCYVWTFIAFGLCSMTWLVLVVWQILAKALVMASIANLLRASSGNQRMQVIEYEQVQQQQRKSNKENQKRSYREDLDPQKSTLKRLEISEHTLRHEIDEQAMEPIENIQLYNRFHEPHYEKLIRLPVTEVRKTEPAHSLVQNKEQSKLQQSKEVSHPENMGNQTEQVQIQQQVKDKSSSRVPLSSHNTEEHQPQYKTENQETQKKNMETVVTDEERLVRSGKILKYQINLQPYQRIDQVQKIAKKQETSNSKDRTPALQQNSEKGRSSQNLGVKKKEAFAFFGKIADRLIEYNDEDSRRDDFLSKQSRQMERRKAQSKAEVREKPAKDQREISSVMKVGREQRSKEMMKIVQLQSIIQRNISEGEASPNKEDKNSPKS